LLALYCTALDNSALKKYQKPRKTAISPSHGENTGSSPVGVTNIFKYLTENFPGLMAVHPKNIVAATV
jgi:hypothetical protein